MEIPPELRVLAGLVVLLGETECHWDGETLKPGWDGRSGSMPPLGTLDIGYCEGVRFYGHAGCFWMSSSEGDGDIMSADYTESISEVRLPR